MSQQNNEPQTGADGFENGLKRLELIVKELEQGQLPLERALALYEEGTALNKKLAGRLDEAERRIDILSKDARGAPDTRPFEPPESAES